MPQLTKRNWRKFFIVSLIGIVVIALFFANEQLNILYKGIKNVLAPFITGTVIAFVFNVPVRALEKRLGFIKNREFRRIISISVTAIVVLSVITVVLYLLINQIVVELDRLLKNENIDIPGLQKFVEKMANLDDLSIREIFTKILEEFEVGFESILLRSFAALKNVTKAIFNILLGTVFAIYCLFQKETLVRQGRKVLYAFFPERRADYIVRIVRLTNSTFKDFLTGQCVEVCILGALFAITMLIFKMPYVLLVSTVIAVTAFIPIVGAWTGCAFGSVLMLLDGDPIKALLFVVLSIVVQQFENNVIYPKVVGNSIGLSGMWVLLAVAVGGALFGAAGMLLMIPMASVIQTLVREETNKRLVEKNIAPDKICNVIEADEKPRKAAKKNSKKQPKQ